MLFGMLIGRCQKTRFSGLMYPLYVLYIVECIWQKVVLQKDKIYYFKYREIEGIFTIDNHIVFLHRSTLNRNLLYMYILSYF